MRYFGRGHMATDINAQELARGLQALSDSSFPKQCGTCGRKYDSPEDFVTQSEPVNGRSGLKKSYDDDDRPILELFRNCLCGSTLLDFFQDRRDLSEQGLRRREVFGKLLLLLQEKGLSAQDARAELLKVMRGQPSETLEMLGVRLRMGKP